MQAGDRVYEKYIIYMLISMFIYYSLFFNVVLEQREELEAEINKRKEEIENKRKEVEKIVDSQLKLSDHDSSNKSPVD